METSSPLASLQPNHPGLFSKPSGPFCGPARGHYEAPSFNFKDMSMFNKTRPDYFSFNPVRGSSPTASLAADLSQNFHIDQSPRLPTPRRNLFNAPSTGFGGSRGLHTPPIPSSSPGPDCSAMDLSPLPHKPASAGLAPPMPYGVPTPEPTPLPDGLAAPIPATRADMLNIPRPHSARPALGHTRRVSNGTRPSIRKGYSSASLQLNSALPQPPLAPPFVFGPPGSYKPAPPPILESFADSPPSERKLPPSSSSSSLFAGPLPKLSFPDNGSPVGPLRRNSGPRGVVPRVGLGRRTQSLQYNAIRPMRQEKRCCTEGSFQPSVDLHEARALRLPHFRPEEEVDALPRISKETLIDVINGSPTLDAGSLTIVDCRFEYEFEGGHIDGAINFNDKEALATELFSPVQTLADGGPSSPPQRTLVFHCEYSNHRAPIMAKFIRQRDRSTNSWRYPFLTYPEIYILDGGYSTFFKAHRSLCVPQNYVEMDSKEHEAACERGMAKVKRRAKLSRSQTYAFGQSAAAAPPAPPGLPGLPAMDLNAPAPAHSPSGLDAMDVDMAFDSPAPPPRAGLQRRNDSY